MSFPMEREPFDWDPSFGFDAFSNAQLGEEYRNLGYGAAEVR